MIDLHTHSIFSDGVLLPCELARRAESIGIKVLSITDHIDISNLDHVIPRIVRACEEINKYADIQVIPGAEITHAPVKSIARLVKNARELGAKIVLVHGETIVEPVLPGTNLAALKADIDILAHPGLISEKEVCLAKEKGIFIELSGRKGHSLTNGHVASLSLKIGASLVFNSDSHEPGDLIDQVMAKKIIVGAGLTSKDFEVMLLNSKNLISDL